MKTLLDIWDAVPWGWRVGIFVIIAVVFITTIFPRSAISKFVQKIPILSERDHLLLNAILCAFIALSVVVLNILTIGNPKTTVGARVSGSIIGLVFGVVAIARFQSWRKGKNGNEHEE